MGAFVLRLPELYFRWQKQNEGESEERDDPLLVQLMVGSIKQELSRRLRPSEEMTFEAI